MSAAIWSYLPQLYDMLRLNGDVWLLARRGNNRTPLGELGLRVLDVIYHVQKVKENNLIYHFSPPINYKGICVSQRVQQLECESLARAAGHEWVSRPFFDIIAQINFSGWESS